MKNYIVEALVTIRVEMPIKFEEDNRLSFDEQLTTAINKELGTLTFSESSTYLGTEKRVSEILEDETDPVNWDFIRETDY